VREDSAAFLAELDPMEIAVRRPARIAISYGLEQNPTSSSGGAFGVAR